MRKRIALTVVAMLVVTACAPEDSPPEPRNSLTEARKQAPIESQFVAIANSAVSDGSVPGIQFALVEDGEVLMTGAVGLADRETGRPMTTETPINVASISKPVTAWGFMALIEEEHLDPDTAVAELLRDEGLHDEIFGGADVTLRMLLAHTSGLSGSSVPVTPVSEPIPEIPDILMGRSSVRRASIEQTPGEGFSYSGAGYLVLQQILETRSRRDFADYMDEKVLRPAGMRDSTFVVSPEWHSRIAVYYRGDGRRREPYHLPGAAGALYSTANDMARYLLLYTERGASTRDSILPEARFSEMLSPVAPVEQPDANIADLQYAHGHYTYTTQEGTRIVCHAGGNPGLRALFVVAPETGHGFFAVANGDRGSGVLAEMLSAWGRHYEVSVHTHF